jgi:alpha-galactosidase
MVKDEIVAAWTSREIVLDAANPAPVWQRAVPIAFCGDWQGKNADPACETQVRALWSTTKLYLRFECRYRELFLFPDCEENGRRDHLWDRDVAEVFLQPDPSCERHYKEFQVSPNGMWVDLDIFPGGRSDLNSGMTSSFVLDEAAHRWTAELAIPMRSLTDNFDPKATWRANFFRIEGSKEPRHYMAWKPTHAPKPDFHVPSAFGQVKFSS